MKSIAVLAAVASCMAAQTVPISSSGPLVSCTLDKTIRWPDIPECDKQRSDVNGEEYFPSIVFQLEKRLESGDRIVVDHSIFLAPCNTDGVDGTENSYEWNAPDELPALWNYQGGEANEGSKKFSLTAHFLTNGIAGDVTFTPFDFTFNAACTFKTDPKTPVCTTTCAGPTARCTTGVCECGDKSATLTDGICVLPAPETPGACKSGEEGCDCQDAAPPCLSTDLECKDGKCRAVDVTPVQPTCDATHCNNISGCAACRESAQVSGKPCQYCVKEDGSGVCSPVGSACADCPAESELKPLSQECEAIPEEPAATPTGDTPAAGNPSPSKSEPSSAAVLTLGSALFVALLATL
mmetsp:Transcript_8370/g.14465  ORF Transcript_8370/g.14465 Transcript_8370/m.14465 type:complete len:352 (-) Transcript_8370:40-1095(-)